MERKLKPCPFCGCTDFSIVDEGGLNFIECNGCLGAFYRRGARTVDDNVEAWNKRTIITKYDKYTFNGDWACTDHMTITIGE